MVFAYQGYYTHLRKLYLTELSKFIRPKHIRLVRCKILCENTMFRNWQTSCNIEFCIFAPRLYCASFSKRMLENKRGTYTYYVLQDTKNRLKLEKTPRFLHLVIQLQKEIQITISTFISVRPFPSHPSCNTFLQSHHNMSFGMCEE